MKLMNLLLAPWAIPQDRLIEMRELYLAHTRREKLDLKAWEAATGRPAGAEREPYTVLDGVAVLPIQGILTKADSAWNRLCGMASTVQLRQDLQTALDDPGVHSILLWIDSPGGMVDGTQELASAVRAAREQKPVTALADGCMCSAAYWVGSAAEQIFITSDTTEVGSIGVVATHVDVSKSEEQYGRKTTEITAGAYKRIASQFAPLSEPGRASIQAQVDHIYSVFVESVSQNRSVSVDTVLSQMADGRVFLGKQAIEAGLVDGVSSLPELITKLNQERKSWTPGAGAASSLVNPPEQENAMPITREQLAAEAPELLKTIMSEGASSELARVQGCLAASLPGYEKLALGFALDGQTQPGDAALKVIAAQNADLEKAQAAVSDGPDALPSAGDAEAIEAAAAADAAGEKPKDARAHAREIKDYQAAEAAKGRTVTAAQASRELAAKEGK